MGRSLWRKIKKGLLIIRDFLSDFFTTPWFFYDPRYKINGLKWTVHKNDVDPYPSIPHMHAKEKPYVLNIYDGSVYDKINRKYVSSITKKDLKNIWEDEKMFELIMFNRDNYSNKNELPKLPHYADKLINRLIGSV